MTDDEGRMQVINAQALRLLRLFGKPETWVNITGLELIKTLRRITPRAARLIAEDMRRLREDTEQAAEGELEIPPHTLHWQSVPVRVGIKPMGRLFVLRDMTEERALEQLREDVTRTMVHDLRNPLSGISAALDMVVDGTLRDISTDQRQVLSIAFQSSARMMQLVSAILDVSRLENGQS